MILQALKEYYDRKAADPNSGIAPLGWEWKEFYYVISIDGQGNLINVESTLAVKDGKQVAKSCLVPKSVGRSGQKSYATVFFLWDHRGYVLGCPKGDPKSTKQHESWVKIVTSLRAEFPSVASIAAIDEFNQKLNSYCVDENPLFNECLKDPINRNILFRVDGKQIFEYSDVKDAYQKYLASEVSGETIRGRCLITGCVGELARIHRATPISKDAKFFVSFQKGSGYDSYGKEQAYNAPVSVDAEFAYTTALATLLGKNSRQKMKIGDATVVFWTSKDSPFEDKFADIFDDSQSDDPDRLTNNVAALLSSVKTGAYMKSDESTRFHVLGLAPSSVRISVRFWHAGTVAEMSERFAQWFEDLAMAHGPKDKDHLSLFRLLVSVAPLGKAENVPPNLAGSVMRTILEGLPLPETLLQAALRRIKAEKGEVNYPRAKIIKACLNRKIKFTNSKERMLTVSLDKQNTNIGYRLGRLFAVLERIQEAANPGLNATIRDKYYASASATPATVFGTLMRLKNHHLAKLNNIGQKVNFERTLGEVVDAVPRFPSHLKADEQGQFAIGYYHQRQDFFTKHESSETGGGNESDNE